MQLLPKNHTATCQGGYASCSRGLSSGNMFSSQTKHHFVIKEAEELTAIKTGDKGSDRSFISGYPFGEAVSLKASAANANVVTVFGRDYMGQPMTEEITLNGQTAVTGKKAFKTIHLVSLEADATTDVMIAGSNKLGLKFHTAGLDKAIVNGVMSEDVEVTPAVKVQTKTSGDPRGLIDASALNDGDELDVIVFVTDFCTKDDQGKDSDGGLYGFKHV